MYGPKGGWTRLVLYNAAATLNRRKREHRNPSCQSQDSRASSGDGGGTELRQRQSEWGR